MQLPYLIGGAVLIATIGLSAHRDANGPSQPSASTPPATVAPIAAPAPIPAPPVANGHFVLVVEGDRNGLAVSFARKKQSRWAGIAKGFDSNWRVSIRDANGRELADVPLDVTPFATDAQSVGKGPRVHGCVVVESRIGLLLNVPAYDAAHSYAFSRTEADGTPVALGTTTGHAIRELAGGGR